MKIMSLLEVLPLATLVKKMLRNGYVDTLFAQCFESVTVI